MAPDKSDDKDLICVDGVAFVGSSFVTGLGGGGGGRAAGMLSFFIPSPSLLLEDGGFGIPNNSLCMSKFASSSSL